MKRQVITMEFDISTYGLDDGIVDKVNTYLNLKGADVESGGLVEIGVPEDVATKIVADYKASLEGGTDDKDGETSETEAEQTKETEQAEGEGETETSDDTGESDGTDAADGTDDTDTATDGDNSTAEDNVDWKQKYEELLFSNMVADAIRGIEFTSSFAKDGVIDLIRKKNLQIVDGKLQGVSELIEEIKSEYPDAFAPTNKRPIFGRTRGTQSDSGTNSAMAYLAQRYKNNPYFKG